MTEDRWRKTENGSW